jgi:hypothetical protein
MLYADSLYFIPRTVKNVSEQERVMLMNDE